MADYRLCLGESASRKSVTIPVKKDYILLRQSGTDWQIRCRSDNLDSFTLRRIGGSSAVEKIGDSTRENCRDQECCE